MQTRALAWKYFNSLPEGLREEIDLSALQAYASTLRNGVRCTIAPISTAGDRHWILLLLFEDEKHYVARIPKHKSKSEAEIVQEIATMEIIAQKTGITVPKVLCYEATENNVVRAPFILMELLPGNVAMDENGGYSQHRGSIPENLRETFYKQVAMLHVDLSSIRFPKIGIVVKREDGSYDIGPFPSLGGPFNCAQEYFEAWAENATFPFADRLSRLPDSVKEEIIASIESFPLNVRNWSALYGDFHHGPFPLAHTDFHHSNIIVNEQYHVTGIIDFEGACTLPWEMMTFPTFLETIPRKMDALWNYDGSGQPIDKETQVLWRDRDSYSEFVRQSEEILDKDHNLSTMLRDKYVQGIAFALGGYESGKQALYHSVFA